MKLNTVSLNEAGDLMMAVIGDAFERGIKPPNIHLGGSPGVGKSYKTHDVASQLAKEFNREVIMIDVRLACFQESEVQGIPHNVETGRSIGIDVDGVVLQVNEQVMTHSTPSWFPENKEKLYILFLDEILNAGVNVQQAAYRILLDRSIQNGKVLPITTAIVTAGNLKSDKTGAKRFLPAAANRIDLHLEIDYQKSLPGFIEHAIKMEWNEMIVGYLNWKPQDAYVNTGEDDAFTTFRTWESANKHLQNKRIKADQMDIAIAGALGSATAISFAGYREYYDKVPDFKKIRSGKLEYKIPHGDQGLKFAISTSIAFQFMDVLGMSDREQANKEAMNLCKLLDQLEEELTICMFRTLTSSKHATKIFTFKDSILPHFNRVSDKMRSIK
jgi:hypothetical protein